MGGVAWVNTRPLVCGTPFARSADAREARFFIEFTYIVHYGGVIKNRLDESDIMSYIDSKTGHCSLALGILIL